MPITFYGYGRASTDKQVMSPETQQSMTRKEFDHQLATNQLPADSVWGGFFADPDTSRAVPFLHRKMGICLALKAKPGDRICVSALDRLLGSPADCQATIEWARDAKVALVIMDMRIDSSTSAGQTMLEVMCAFKGYERREIGRRTKESHAHRREMGLPTGYAPIGYQIKTIIPVGGGKPMKYFMPWIAERNYANMIVAMHDVQKLSFRQIAINLWRNKVVKPRSKKVTCEYKDAHQYYVAATTGWPLHGGVQWKPPSFAYKLVSKDADVIDLNRVSA